MESSPHAWGCFLEAKRQEQAREVFPTRVGVFLRKVFSEAVEAGPSPHAWGCFPAYPRHYMASCVFPTRVGVFLTSRLVLLLAESLPHTRGGVSIGTLAKMESVLSSPHAWGCFHLARLHS